MRCSDSTPGSRRPITLPLEIQKRFVRQVNVGRQTVAGYAAAASLKDLHARSLLVGKLQLDAVSRARAEELDRQLQRNINSIAPLLCLKERRIDPAPRDT